MSDDDRCGFCSAKFSEPPLPDCAFPERHPDRNAPIDNSHLDESEGLF